MPLRQPEHVVSDLKRVIDSRNSSDIRLNANGGNSILVVCEPEREHSFIDAIEELPPDKYQIIDVNKCLIEFVTENHDSLNVLFDLLQSSVGQIFKCPESETTPDLFKLLIGKVSSVFDSGRIPVLINSGALYGTGIDNIHLMEDKVVMESQLPLVILYPAEKNKEELLFLGKRHASKYRCMVIQ